jgi:hypothetical protein
VPEEWQRCFKHGTAYMTLMHSHHNLREIFYYMWDCKLAPRGTFVDMVFRLVMFHQSIEGCPKWPPMSELSASEQAMYCDLRFYALMKVVMICDSESYSCCGNQVTMMKQRIEFCEANDRMQARWSRLWQEYRQRSDKS